MMAFLYDYFCKEETGDRAGSLVKSYSMKIATALLVLNKV